MFVALELLSASIWVGSLVCLAVVDRVGRSSFNQATQVAFFRALGRRYAVLGSGAVAVPTWVGLAMAWPPASWSATLDAVVALVGFLVVISLAAMAQARAMGTLRRRFLGAPSDPGAQDMVRRGRIVARTLRVVW